MTVSVELVNRSTIIFVMVLSFGIHCFGLEEMQYCDTTSCWNTGSDFKQAMDLNVSNPCSDYYRFACGSSMALFDITESQEVYLKNLIHLYDAHEIPIWNPHSDTDLVKLIKQYRGLCDDGTQSIVERSKAIVKFLHTVADGTSWWELENWAVSNGFNSTLFSVEIVHAHHEHGFITLLHPDTRSLQDNYSNTSRNMVTKLQEAGLNATMADRLFDGITKEQELYSSTTVGADHLTGWMPTSKWHELWNTKRKIPNNITQNGWEEYLGKYWNTAIHTSGIIPILNNGRFKVVIGDSLSVETFGSAFETFTDANIKNIILWRMVTQLVDYAGEKTRDPLKLFSTQNCLTPAMKSALEKLYWLDVIPKAIRTQIKKMYSKIDLQAKLLAYKELIKVPQNEEPLTPREKKNLKYLVDAQRDTNIMVDNLKSQLDLLKKQVEMMKHPEACTGAKHDQHHCYQLNVMYVIVWSKFKTIKETKIKELQAQFDAKSAEYNNSTSRLEAFWAKNINRTSVDPLHEEKTMMFQHYIKNRYYPKFPFEDTVTRLKPIIQTPAPDADYVQLGLALKKWERAMLLQAPQIFERNIEDEKFMVNGFTNIGYDRIRIQIFRRFQNHRPSSLNYGSLGSALGYEISLGLRKPVIDADTINHLEDYLYMNVLGSDVTINTWSGLFGFLFSELPEVYNWVSVPILVSTLVQFLQKNPDPMMHYDLNVTEWLLNGYKSENTWIGLNAAWNARQHDLRFKDEIDERLAYPTGDKILPRFNQDMLFFHAFSYSNCEADYLTFGKTIINELLNSHPNFTDVYRKQTVCS